MNNLSAIKQDLSRYGIGASEISSVAGLNPYASPWNVYLQKTGQAPDVEQNEPMEWGHRLEPAIRQKYADEHRVNLWVPPSSMFHTSNPWARATPDGIVLRDSVHWEYLLQCKNVGHWVEKAWSDAPPAYVQLQEQWELYVTGLARADVAVLIGGNDFRVYTVHRDDKTIADLVTIATDFWKRVETRTPPLVDDSDACKEHFESRFAKHNQIEIKADADLDALFRDWQRLTNEAKRTKSEIERIRNVVRQHLADAQACRIVSTYGTASLTAAKEETVTETNWKLVAELAGTGLDKEKWDEIVKANTATTTETKKPTLYAPRSWAKEHV